MSSDEIAGQAVKRYSDAKKALAHSDSTLTSAAEHYQLAAHVLLAHAGDSFGSAEQVILEMNPVRKNGVDLTLPLVDGDDLMSLLQQHEQIRKRVADAYTKLNDLGFGNVS